MKLYLIAIAQIFPRYAMTTRLSWNCVHLGHLNLFRLSPVYCYHEAAFFAKVNDF